MAAPDSPSARSDWRAVLVDRGPFLVACLMPVVLVAIYGSLREGVFTLEELNIDTAAAMTLLLAATGQTAAGENIRLPYFTRFQSNLPLF